MNTSIDKYNLVKRMFESINKNTSKTFFSENPTTKTLSLEDTTNKLKFYYVYSNRDIIVDVNDDIQTIPANTFARITIQGFLDNLK